MMETIDFKKFLNDIMSEENLSGAYGNGPSRCKSVTVKNGVLDVFITDCNKKEHRVLVAIPSEA